MPKKFVPQIAYAIGIALNHDQLPSDFLINEASLVELFGSSAGDLMKELSRPFPMEPVPERETPGIDLSLVNDRARRWLEKRQKAE